MMKNEECCSLLLQNGDKYICQVCGQHFTKEDNDILDKYLKRVKKGKESPFWETPSVISAPSHWWSRNQKLKPVLPAVKFYTTLDGEIVRTILTEDDWNRLNCYFYGGKVFLD